MAAVTRYPVGSVLRGKVTHLEPFGAFVEIVPGVEGLVPIGALGGGRRINNPREAVAEGQELDVRVETIDVERRRMGLKPADARGPERTPGSPASGTTAEDVADYFQKRKEPGNLGSLGEAFDRQSRNQRRV